MKRLHVHRSVRDLPRSVRFYGELFAAEPTVESTVYGADEIRTKAKKQAAAACRAPSCCSSNPA